ncbi:sigma-54-dependent Fis family transcriptional regulator [Mesorhizobium loti]|uniref:C4-dicarboxylate transport system regulatory protein n=1 Tax=Rhizobium loti TaxID=381 RepID=M5B2I3_RHILI|nr:MULTISPECIES: sigma-54 dependent transcriptional regulator [Mesorhizobium]ANN60985.1 Fis family transcriptional regulator [Mesorhizobium loti NZP2037]OBP79999.1 Fis family transcriptional regulator [Mesorhizobium loti]OBP85548.1 Fis family transcriptional regulator [Mesorhizobium loti]OBP96897.1 Fis family transcriptional regulator [Mesorhizobium loti]OBQ59059.1 Fis family transcriptional regulator [Mesorhizobium loti]
MNAETGPVIFIDDNEDLLRAATQMLKLASFSPSVFGSAEAALASIDENFDGPVVSDIRMPGLNGLQLFERVKAIDPDIPVVLITGHGDVELAVAAVKNGAYDFISKPYANDRLLVTLHRASEKRRLVLENRRLRDAVVRSAGDIPLIGEAPTMIRLRETLRQIADTDVDVLVEGETGTGKEVVADLLHRWSKRRTKPFVALNCGALPESVIDSELFGHEAGAFTGAQRRRTGRIEHSNGGTLFLDEIKSMPPALQVKLLRVLETRQITPLGTNETRSIDLRIVSATKADLGDPAARGDFREDLYFRLNVVTLRIPALRERREDIPILFGHFLERAAKRFGRPVPDTSAGVRDRLMSYNWPGNVRELVHFADRVALGLEEVDTPIAPGRKEQAVSNLPLSEKISLYEATVIRDALQECGGDVKRTIEILGVPRKTFYDKLKRHGIDAADYRRNASV